jgi:signal transduction histidine kinase
LAISVSDTGIGIAPEEIAVALEFFGQVDNRLARKHEGTGIGLPLSKQLVEFQGGSMTLDSTPGIGTTITIAFPAECLIERSLAAPIPASARTVGSRLRTL